MSLNNSINNYFNNNRFLITVHTQEHLQLMVPTQSISYKIFDTLDKTEIDIVIKSEAADINTILIEQIQNWIISKRNIKLNNIL
jgi:hypothetical protein